MSEKKKPATPEGKRLAALEKRVTALEQRKNRQTPNKVPAGKPRPRKPIAELLPPQ